MMKKMILGVLLTCSMFVGPEASALNATSDWQIPLSTCIPEPDTILNDLHVTGSSVGFKTGAIGTIRFRCLVSSELEEFNVAEVSYRDSDGGTSTNASVQVQLSYYCKYASPCFTFPTTLMNSNTAGSPTTFQTRTEALGSTISPDHINYYYWVTVTMSRTATTQTVVGGHVRLYYLEP